MYDCIVLGTGGVGSAALWHLAKRGHRVLGLDRFGAGHDRGSSHGQTRVIRQVYFEHTDYVPLLQRAYELWSEVQEGSKEPLWSPTGLVQVGPTEGEVIRGVLKAAQDHQLPIERLSPDEHRARFPHLGLPDDMVSVFEPTGGVLQVEACVRHLLTLAQHHNAECVEGVQIQDLEARGDHWRVRTDQGLFEASRVIVAAGPWAPQLLPRLAPFLSVVRKVLLWYANTSSTPTAEAPVFLYELPEGVFYGFPGDSRGQVKVAQHTGCQPVADPLSVARALQPADHNPVDQFADRWLAQISEAQPIQHAVCMYTLSPDLHFLLGCLEPGLAVAAGLSGHGYKFAPVIGEALADLAMQGGSDLPIDFLAPSRLFA